MPSLSSFEYTEGTLKSRHFTEYHENILNAVVERDHSRAIKLMDDHLQELEERLKQFLK
jgi:DNA-binding GntR family transcriptional regulator